MPVVLFLFTHHYISPVLGSNVGFIHTYAISGAKSPQFDLFVAVFSLVAMDMLIKAKRQLALTFTLIVPNNVTFDMCLI